MTTTLTAEEIERLREVATELGRGKTLIRGTTVLSLLDTLTAQAARIAELEAGLRLVDESRGTRLFLNVRQRVRALLPAKQSTGEG